MLRPTIRAEGSELWFSWNPRLKNDPVDAFLRADEPPPDAIVVKANYNDNIWFPEVLEKERLETLRSNPDNYEHIWEGGYQTVTEGAYYAVQLAAAREEGRVGHVARDPHLPVRAFWDIGGTGSRSDARAIWIAQFVGKEIDFSITGKLKARSSEKISIGFVITDMNAQLWFFPMTVPPMTRSTMFHINRLFKARGSRLRWFRIKDQGLPFNELI